MDTPNIFTKWSACAPYFKSVLRMVSAILFIMPGTMKLFAYPMGMPPDGGTAQFMSQVWVGGVLEFGGGIMILLGLCTRPVAFILAGEMAVAYFQFHQPQGLWPMMNGGTDAVLYCFLWLYYSASGSGIWSIDSLISKNKLHS